MFAWLKGIFSASPALPDQPSGEAAMHKSRGDDCLDGSDWDGAANHYRAAIAAFPHYAEAHSNLGFALAQQWQFDLAQHHLNLAVSLKPGLFNSFYILGTVAYRLGHIDDAIAHFNKAIAIKPDFAEAIYELGKLHVEKGEQVVAFELYQRVLALDPNMVAALVGVAALWEYEGSRREAIECYRRALEAAPEKQSVRLCLLHQLMHICSWDDLDSQIAMVRHSVRESPADAENFDSPFSFLALPGTTAAEQKRCAEKWVYAMYRPQYKMRELLGFTYQWERGDRPHIAYMSSDFCEHATAYLIAEVFERHDHGRFKISAYCYSPDDNSPMRARLKASFDQFVEIGKLSDLEAAKRIHADRVDILVDLKAYTGGTRSAILALQPAPIQVNFLGYPGTMGADFVDYLIADRFVIPPQSQADYSEKIAYLPDTYQPNDRSRAQPPHPGRMNVGLPETGFVFCCFNQSYKITPEIFNIWCALLRSVPGSVLWLIASKTYVHENLQRQAESRGVARERLIFAPRVGADEHLARQQCADLFLDTIPYNAHTTCSDALWMGLPVVTIAGDTFSSRVAGSLLSALGVPELITYHLDEYRALALELALDDRKRGEIRAKIMANRQTAPLYDSQLFTRNLERAYLDMLDAQKDNHRRIRIVIVCPDGYRHSHAFDEIAETVKCGFQALGYAAAISRNSFDRHCRNIVFGANMIDADGFYEIPPHSVIYNLEQVYASSPWMTKTMLRIFQKFEVWDYSQRNVEAIRSLVPGAKVKYVKIGYAASMTRIEEREDTDIDVLFYGSMNPRRKKIVDELALRGVRVSAVFGVYGEERDALIARAKLVLNMRFYESDIFEIVRVSYLLANRKAVVSECNENTDIEDDMRDAVALAPYEKMVDTCIELLANEQKRKELAERGFRLMSARVEEDFLAAAVHADL